MKRAQTLSTDAVVAVILFIVAALFLYYLTGPVAQNKQSEKLQSDAERLPSLLSTEQNFTGGIVKGSKVSAEMLAQAVNLSYRNLKELLGMQSDFCIYFEDEKGNVVPVQDKWGIGSQAVNISGKSCNDSIS